jgi:predicted O-methyltransferase YrrM
MEAKRVNFDLSLIRHIIDDSLGLPIEDEYLESRVKEQPVHHYYYNLFYNLAKELKPNFVVELGGWQGTAAACFASGHADCSVITIDHHTDPGDEYNKERMFEACDRYGNLTYLQGWTWDRHVLDFVGDQVGVDIDILFIDSWHNYDKAMQDWNLYKVMLTSPSLVICDDIFRSNSTTIFEMQKFWDEIIEGRQGFLDARLHSGIPMGFMIYED